MERVGEIGQLLRSHELRRLRETRAKHLELVGSKLRCGVRNVFVHLHLSLLHLQRFESKGSSGEKSLNDGKLTRGRRLADGQKRSDHWL